MYSSKHIPKKKRQSRYKSLMAILLVVVILIISFLSLAFLKQKEAIGLVGTWVSEQTGVVLTFTQEGKVLFKDHQSEAIYRIISPNTIEYTVDNMSFQMIYSIEDDKLHWGVDEQHLETFSWK